MNPGKHRRKSLDLKVPKHQLISDEVRRKIVDGDYPPGMQLPPDNVFHKQWNVNKTTVIRALTDLEREGYIIRRQGSGSFVSARPKTVLFPGRTIRLGVLSRHNLSPGQMLATFPGGIIQGVLDVLGLDGVQPEWRVARLQRASRAEWAAPGHAISLVCVGEAPGSQVRHPPLEEVAAERLDGVITASVIAAGFLEALLDLGLPAVFADCAVERLALKADQVFLDPVPAYRAVVRHLAGQGLRRIHFSGGFVSIPAPAADMSHEDVAKFRQGRMAIDPDSLLRMTAWRQGMLECGLPAPERWAHFENPWFVKDDELARRLLALPAEERPEAILCHSIFQAERLMAEFAERGVRLRGAGVTDGGYGGPALPIRASGRELGAAAAELLISRLQRPGRLSFRVGVPMLFSPPDGSLLPATQVVATPFQGAPLP